MHKLRGPRRKPGHEVGSLGGRLPRRGLTEGCGGLVLGERKGGCIGGCLPLRRFEFTTGERAFGLSEILCALEGCLALSRCRLCG